MIWKYILAYHSDHECTVRWNILCFSTEVVTIFLFNYSIDTNNGEENKNQCSSSPSERETKSNILIAIASSVGGLVLLLLVAAGIRIAIYIRQQGKNIYSLLFDIIKFWVLYQIRRKSWSKPRNFAHIFFQPTVPTEGVTQELESLKRSGTLHSLRS